MVAAFVVVQLYSVRVGTSEATAVTMRRSDETTKRPTAMEAAMRIVS